MSHQSMKLFAVSALLLCLAAPKAHAFGSPKPDPEPQQPPKPVAAQAKPFRYMELKHVTTPAFYFANGQRIDFNTDLNQIIETQINASRYLRTQVDTGTNRSRLVITGGVTTFELDILQMNLKIGWNQNGVLPTPGVPNASGELDMKLSALSMDFKIYDRATGQTYLANYTNETLSNVSFQAKVNVDNISGTLDLLYKTKVAEAFRTAVSDIMVKFEESQSFDLLPWEAQVAGVDREKGLVSFDAGNIAGVKANDVYSIYSSCPPDSAASDGCYMRFLADLKVEHTSNVSADGVPLSPQDSFQNVYAGDRVFVKPLIKPLH